MGAPCVVVSGVRAPAALHASRALAAAGYQVIGVDSLGFPLGRFSKSVVFEHIASPVYDWTGFERDVAAVIERHQPVRWIATCEEIFHLARAAADLTALADVLWAPALGTLLHAHNKHSFAELARTLDGGEVDTRLLTSADDLQPLRGLSRRLVFKPVYSRFAEHVLVRPFADGLDAVRPTPARPWLAQTYLPGEELCAYALAHDGKVTAQTLYKGLYHAGRGASVFFEPAQDARISAFVEAYVAQTRWDGQLAFDFRRDATGRPVAIECNPRATSGIHLWAPDAALGHALMGSNDSLSPERRPQMVGSAMLAAGACHLSAYKTWRKHWDQGQDVVRAGDDLGLWLGQPLALMELGWQALRRRVSLLAASTHDIEWNL